MGRRETAVRLLGLGLVGTLVLAISSGLVRPGDRMPGSRAGQPGPEGSTWLGIGDQARHGDLTVRLTAIEDLRCPAGFECVSAGEVRVHLDVELAAAERRQVVVVVPAALGAGSGPEVGPYQLRVVSLAPCSGSDRPFVWHGVALLVEDLPERRSPPT
jgi:hypothetical protein